jgi:hypothetical protein
VDLSVATSRSPSSQGSRIDLCVCVAFADFLSGTSLPVDSATHWNSSRDSFYGAYEKPSSGTTEYSLTGILTRPTAIDPFPDGFHSSVKPPENARSGIRRILFIGLKRRIPECRHLLRRLGIETVRPTAPEEKCMHKKLRVLSQFTFQCPSRAPGGSPTGRPNC